MDAGVLVPLGVFAMLVAGWYIQSRMAIAQLQALAQERVAAIEKGVPLPPRETEPPEPPVRAGHPLKPTLSVLAVGIALWVGLSPDHRLWGMVVTAFGIAGLGWAASAFHLPALGTVPGAEVVGGCDLSDEQRTEVARTTRYRSL